MSDQNVLQKVKAFTQEQLEEIEEDIESMLMDRFVFDTMTPEHEWRITSWILATLKEEHNIERPISLVWSKSMDYPILMIMDGESINDLAWVPKQRRK